MVPPMNRRVVSSMLSALYLVFAFWGSTLEHHHHEHASAQPHQDCAVCVWHTTHQTTTPTPVSAVEPVVFCSLASFPYAAQPHFTFFSPSSASRAPPIS